MNKTQTQTMSSLVTGQYQNPYNTTMVHPDYCLGLPAGRTPAEHTGVSCLPQGGDSKDISVDMSAVPKGRDGVGAPDIIRNRWKNLAWGQRDR